MIKTKVFKYVCYFNCIFVIGIIFGIIFYILFNGINDVNLDFIIKDPSGIPVGAEGGIYPAIIGSLLLTVIAVISSVIPAISIAIYLTFYNQNKKIATIIRIIIQCISGMPSIVIGLFGYYLLVYKFAFGLSLLSASLTLGLMIFPYIEIKIEKSLIDFPKKLLSSSYSMGLSKSYTICKLVLPYCLVDIISTICLSASFAMGAAAPIIFTGAVAYADVPNSIYSPVMALPYQLYLLVGEGISFERAYAVGIVLLALLFLLNIVPIILLYIGRRLRDELFVRIRKN